MLLTAACTGDSSQEDSPPVEVTFARVDVTNLPILFTSDRTGNSDLWLSGADGSDPTQLTTSAGDEGFGTWSPDGTRIAFGASTDPNRGADVYVVNADGTELHQVTDLADSDEGWPVWSPDGSQLLYTETAPGEEFGTLKTIGADGERERELAENAAWGDWSPDGTQIVYAAPDEGEPGELRIWVMDAGGGNQRTVGPESLVSPNEPTWSPDGTQIAFSAAFGDPDAENPADWDYDVLVMAADGSGVKKVADLEGNEHYPAAWSPDGRHLVFTADGVELEAEIVSLDLLTGDVTKVTDNDAHDLVPDWRPDPSPSE